MVYQLITGFITASLVQAGIIMLGENLNMTMLNAQLDLMQLITHVITGVVAGFILYYLIKNIDILRKSSFYTIGIIYGVILWPLVLGIASTQNKVISPLKLNSITIIWTLTAFAVFGIIVNFTIHRYALDKI